MAKQNFIAGGYVGKLGETVGQRWKNMRTVRVYVIPHNPRTPAQQACRRKFAEAVPYAQIGLTFNAKAPCWEATDKTEWQGRMSVAKTNVDNGLSGRNAIPLFPLGYTPANTVTEVAYMDEGGGDYRLFLSGSQDIEAGRRFMLSVECENTETGEMDEVMVEAVAAGDVQNSVEMHLDGHVLDEGDIIFGVSCDDADFSGAMCHVPPQELGLADVVVIDDWRAVQDGSTLAVTLTSEKLRGAGEDVSVTAYRKLMDVFTGQYIERTGSATFAAGTGSCEVYGYPETYSFVGSSMFGGNGASVSVGGVRYVFPNVPVSLAGKYQTSWEVLGASVSWSADVGVDSGEGVSRLVVSVGFTMTQSPSELENGAVQWSNASVECNVGGVATHVTYRIDDGELDNVGTGYEYHFYSEDNDELPDVPQTGTARPTHYVLETDYAVIASEWGGSVEIS